MGNFESETLDRFRYRAGWRSWLYAIAATNPRQEWELLTLTLADGEINGSVISNHDPEHLRRLIIRHAERTSIDGFVILEFGKRGNRRIHAHAIVDAGYSASQLAQNWNRAQLGFAARSPVTDLLGAISYITKSLNEDSLFAACGRYRNREGEVETWQHGSLRRPVSPTTWGEPLPTSQPPDEAVGQSGEEAEGQGVLEGHGGLNAH